MDQSDLASGNWMKQCGRAWSRAVLQSKAPKGREKSLFGNKVYYILRYKKRYGEKVPFTKAYTSSLVRKNYVRFVPSSLLNFYSSHISISCPFKQNWPNNNRKTTKTKKIKTKQNKKQLKIQLQCFVHLAVVFVWRWLLCFQSALASNRQGLSIVSPGMKSFPKKPQEIVHFFFSLSFFCQLSATLQSV